MHILSIDRNKSPLQISGQVAVCIVRTLKTFQGTHILGASHGLLCDSLAVLYHLLQFFTTLASAIRELLGAKSEICDARIVPNNSLYRSLLPCWNWQL